MNSSEVFPFIFSIIAADFGSSPGGIQSFKSIALAQLRKLK
jgi:hypothetical protein